MALVNRKIITSRFFNILLVITATICWSTSGIFIKLIIRQSSLSAVGLAFWRDLATTMLLLAGMLIIKPQFLLVKKKDLPWLIGMGVISIGVFHVFWNQSVVMIGPSVATAVQGNTPIVVTIIAWFLFGERITSRKMIAMILAATGTILVSGMRIVGEWKIAPIGLLFALGSAIAYGTLTLFGKKLSSDYSPWTIMLYIFGFGTLTLFTVQLGSPDPWPAEVNVLLLFVGFVLFTTIIGFALYTSSLKFLPAGVAAITATSEIFFASLLAYIFLGERMDMWQVIGSVLIIFGVVLVSLTKDGQTNSVNDREPEQS